MKSRIQFVCILAVFGVIFTAFGQVVYKSITLDQNGVVLAPTNLWTTNSPGIASSLTNSFAPLSHALATNNPHSVTKAQVGLGAVDNTSDLSKPISTAVQTALDGKVATNDSRLTNSRAPSGSAAGDLAGTYPAPTLATNGVTAGSYGSQTNTLSVTVDAKGRVSGISTNTPITPASIGAATTAQGALADSAVQVASTNTLSNKTISGSSNTLTNIPAANLTGTVSTNQLPVQTLNLSGGLHNSPVTMTNGVGTATLANQSANTFFAGPATGTNAAPTFRAMLPADMPVATATTNGALSTSAQDISGVKTLRNSLEFEGATVDANETTVAVTDPTADRTITIPDTSGTATLDTTLVAQQFSNYGRYTRAAFNVLSGSATANLFRAMDVDGFSLSHSGAAVVGNYATVAIMRVAHGAAGAGAGMSFGTSWTVAWTTDGVVRNGTIYRFILGAAVTDVTEPTFDCAWIEFTGDQSWTANVYNVATGTKTSSASQTMANYASRKRFAIRCSGSGTFDFYYAAGNLPSAPVVSVSGGPTMTLGSDKSLFIGQLTVTANQTVNAFMNIYDAVYFKP